MDGLKLTFDLWDVERYQGISEKYSVRYDPHWVGRWVLKKRICKH